MSAVPAKGEDTPATREQVVALLELLSTRMLWSPARALISATSIHVSRGWGETINAAKSG